MDELGERAGRWLLLSEAAARLGLTGEALRKRLRRGQAQGRRDNKGRWLIFVPDDSNPVQSERPGLDPDGELERTRTELAVVRDKLERTGTDLAEARALADRRQAELDMARAEVAERDVRLARLEATVEAQRAHLTDLQAELARRRWSWPGLRMVWRRVVDGTGAGGGSN